MKKDNTLQFIAAVIGNLGTSVFHDYRDEMDRLQSGIADTINVDEDGTIWALVNDRDTRCSEPGEEFPVGLHYYKKSNPFYLNISGKASIGQQPFDKEGYRLLSDKILLRIKIFKAEYVDLQEKTLIGRMNTFFERLYNNLFRVKQNGTVIHRLVP